MAISRFLLAADPGSQYVHQSLHMLCTSSKGNRAALYRRHYTTPHSYHLTLMGSVSAENPRDGAFPDSITPDMVDPPSWRALNSDTVCVFNGKCKQLFTERCLSVVPLIIKNLPYGFLLVSSSQRQTKGSIEFLSTVGNLFSLWINRVDTTKRMEDVFTSIPTPSFIMTTDENIVYWNKANELMTGWKADQIVGKGNYESSLPYYGVRRPMVANLIMYEDDEWQSTYFEFEKGEDHVNALAFCPTLPGGGAFLRTNTNKLYDFNNRLWGAIHAVRDVTLERQMHANLQRSESMYRSIADFAGVGILLVNNAEIIYANEQAEEFLGKSCNDIGIADLEGWAKLDGNDTIHTIIKRLLRGEDRLMRFEFHADRGGATAYFNALAQPIPHDNQQIIHFVIDDVTEQKELDRRARMNELKLMHEERLTSLGIMAAGIAHELNQPLNTIRVVTDGFLYGNEMGWKVDRQEIINNVEMISKQVSRMSTVIRNIRNFSREDQSEEFTDVSINKAVETVFSMIGRQFEAHDITVHINLEEKLPVIMAPVNQLEQVVTNLLINARQAFDGCSHGHWQIWVETGERNKSVFLKIADNATGIPDELFEKIFYPFYTTKQVGKGTGLGLSICQTILAGIKGKLEAINNEHGGATFIVNIPLQEIGNENPRN